MRSIRKVQVDCEIVCKCFSSPTIMKTNHKGVVFDKMQKPDGSFIYMVYLEELKMLTRMKTYEEYENYSNHMFKIFLFDDEHSMKKKIRIQRCE